MTKKQYIVMARIFHDALSAPYGTPTSRLAIWDDVVRPFVEFAKADNPRFDESTFVAAVDYNGAHDKAVNTPL